MQPAPALLRTFVLRTGAVRAGGFVYRRCDLSRAAAMALKYAAIFRAGNPLFM